MILSKEESNRRSNAWHKLHDSPKGVIGKVPPLAPGMVNLMEETEKSIIMLLQSEAGANIIKLIKKPPKKKEKNNISLTKIVKRDSLEEDLEALEDPYGQE